MKTGIIREGKIPPDQRVPLVPAQCRALKEQYPELDILVQQSNIRAIPDADYLAAGIPVTEDISAADVLFGVKEVPVDLLIPGKTYFFFSHTIKQQPYNRKLLQAIIAKNITLVDYETLTDARGARLIGFGRYAGIVGCYNGLLAYGRKSGAYELKRAHACKDRKELEEELKKVSLPSGFKVVMTGLGRVAGGAIEILNSIGMKQVTADDFLDRDFDHPVFTQLGVEDYNERLDGNKFASGDFYRDPTGFRSTFPRFLEVADLYVSCHFWDSKAPFLVTREDLKAPGLKTRIFADISCDIDGPVACTLRPSTIEDPLYGYDPVKEEETDFYDPSAIGVMAVDNLPCELPKDASEDFGKELVEKIFPCLLGDDPDRVIERATIAKNGKLTERYSYLKGYLEGNSN